MQTHAVYHAGSKILEYRITDAVPYDAIVHDLDVSLSSVAGTLLGRIECQQQENAWRPSRVSNPGILCTLDAPAHGQRFDMPGSCAPLYQRE